MPDCVIISVNPKAGKRSPLRRAEELQYLLREKGLNVQLLTDLNEVAEKANALQRKQQLRALVGCGGDGTAATLVNLTDPGTPITLLAAGTANLLAKHFRLARTPGGLADMILNSKTLALDAGKVSFEKNGEQQERIFLVMAGCGFDAAVVSGVHAYREQRHQAGHKRGAHISYFSYIKPIFKALTNYRFAKMSIERYNAEKNVWECLDDSARWAFVFNINRYGWGLPLAPFAKENDGLLDAVLMRGGSVFHGCLYTAAAQCFGMHRFLPGVKLRQAARFRLTAERPLPFQLDGDPGGTLPVEIEVLPNRLTLLVRK
ncbi:MAG: hypothetical protein LBN39_11970 [Planctomycetaceae bacterium]|jgi:diacylglycerol kinase family enzyme|nr:hypothetical protein [Planctomycetaceae bacterium]